MPPGMMVGHPGGGNLPGNDGRPPPPPHTSLLHMAGKLEEDLGEAII